MTFNVNYTYSHAIDDGSTWHSGSTSANGGGGGEGYTTDVTFPGLDRGNSIFDIRHRLGRTNLGTALVQVTGRSPRTHSGRLAVQRHCFLAVRRALGALDPHRRRRSGRQHRQRLPVAGCTQAHIDSQVCLMLAATSTWIVFAMIGRTSLLELHPQPRSVGKRLGNRFHVGTVLPTSSNGFFSARVWLVRKHGAQHLCWTERS